eukprot:c20776_g1_i2 orf=489-1535(-)
MSLLHLQLRQSFQSGLVLASHETRSVQLFPWHRNACLPLPSQKSLCLKGGNSAKRRHFPRICCVSVSSNGKFSEFRRRCLLKVSSMQPSLYLLVGLAMAISSAACSFAAFFGSSILWKKGNRQLNEGAFGGEVNDCLAAGEGSSGCPTHSNWSLKKHSMSSCTGKTWAAGACGNLTRQGGIGMALLSTTTIAKDRINPAISTLVANPYFMAGLVAWAMAQLMKVFTSFFVERRWNFNMLLASGGMPSSHSALCVALTTSVAICHGMSDGLFPVCLGFSLIVMYDAIGVRRHAGMQAEVRLLLNSPLTEFLISCKFPFLHVYGYIYLRRQYMCSHKLYELYSQMLISGT